MATKIKVVEMTTLLSSGEDLDQKEFNNGADVLVMFFRSGRWSTNVRVKLGAPTEVYQALLRLAFRLKGRFVTYDEYTCEGLASGLRGTFISYGLEVEYVKQGQSKEKDVDVKIFDQPQASVPTGTDVAIFTRPSSSEVAVIWREFLTLTFRELSEKLSEARIGQAWEGALNEGRNVIITQKGMTPGDVLNLLFPNQA